MTARLEVCTCKKHAHFYTATNFRSPEFCSKDLGSHLIRTAVHFDQFSEADIEKVTEELTASELPFAQEEVDIRLLFVCEVLNQIQTQHIDELQKWSMERIHTALSTPVDTKDIPRDFIEAGKKLVRSSLV